MPSILFLTLLLCVTIAAEGVGITADQTVFFFSYLLLPVCLYGFLLITKNKIRLPPKFLSAILAFLILSSVSSLTFSLDKQISIQRLLFYISLCLMFLFSYSHKEAVKRLLSVALPVLGAFFMGYSFIVHRAVFEKQVVFASYGSHNHLGDFIGLVVILVASFHLNGWKSLLQKIFLPAFFAAVIFSYSRSAYLALALVTALFLFQKRRRLRPAILATGLAAVVVLAISFTLASSVWIRPGSPFSSLQSFIRNRANLTPRDFISGRNVFFTQAKESIIKHPLFGIGGGNFYQASLAGSDNTARTDSAHSLLLEIAVEQGVPAAIIFSIICIILLVGAGKRKSVWGLMLIFLLINFQTDYTYQILLFPVLGAFIAGIVYEERSSPDVPVWTLGLASIALFFVAFIILTSSLLVKANRPLDAIRWYPFNKEAYSAAISQATSWGDVMRFTAAAQMIAPADAEMMFAAAEKADSYGKSGAALALYERMYKQNRLINFEIVTRMYRLKKSLFSPNVADAFLTNVLLDYRDYGTTTESFRKKVGRFCNLNNSTACANTSWFFKE